MLSRDLAVTLTFDLLTSKCYHFVPVPNRTEVIHLVKFHKPLVRYHINKLISYDHAFMHRQHKNRTIGHHCNGG